jgi:hypothetical protein
MRGQYDRILSARAAVDVGLAQVEQQRELVAGQRNQGATSAQAEEQLRVLLQCLEAMRDHQKIIEQETPEGSGADLLEHSSKSRAA